MYGGNAVLEEVATLLDSPVNACLVGFFGGFRLVHQANERLRDIDVEGSRKHLDLLLRRDGFEAGDDGNGDAGLSALFDKAEEALVVEEHLRDDIVGPCLHLLLEMLDVAFQVGCLEVLLGIAATPMQKSVLRPCFTVGSR